MPTLRNLVKGNTILEHQTTLRGRGGIKGSGFQKERLILCLENLRIILFGKSGKVGENYV